MKPQLSQSRREEASYHHPLSMDTLLSGSLPHHHLPLAIAMPVAIPSQTHPTHSSYSSYIPHHSRNYHFISSFSSINLNRISTFLTTTPQALLNNHPSPVTHHHHQPFVEDEEDETVSTPTLKQICEAHVPKHVLQRMEDIGFVTPTPVQIKALPLLFSGRDSILHAQTGSGKTLTYLLLIFSIINTSKSSVQALVLVPTRELGMQVTKVARMLAAKPTGVEGDQKSCTIMALLDGGTLRRHKSWLKAEPPTIVVATIASLGQMLERQFFVLESVRVLVVDEVDFIFNSSKQTSSLRKLLNSYSSCNNRQTVFASASIPQHRRFLHDCVQQKWTKSDVVHIHVSPVEPMPSRLCHRFIICNTKRKLETLLSLIQSDAPESGIIFVGEQSEKSKKVGNAPSTSLVTDFLKASYQGSLDILLLEDDMNFNSRAASLLEVRKGGGYLLVATDIAARGVDLPEMSHIYNFDLPRTAVDYLHRAGRTCRKPFSDMKCTVTTIIVPEERFVLQKYENELMFNCEELIS